MKQLSFLPFKIIGVDCIRRGKTGVGGRAEGGQDGGFNFLKRQALANMGLTGLNEGKCTADIFI